MSLIDTHCHLYTEEFDTDQEEVICRAREAGVERFLLPSIDSESHERLFGLCRAHPECCIPMIGLHPTSVNDHPNWRRELIWVGDYLENPPAGPFCGVGEIGLDFYWSTDFKAEQTEAFRFQIELALAHDLPVAIHVRNAWPQTAALIGEYAGKGLRGVFHAFSETAETYRTLKACGEFVFGIGGVVTFKKSSLAQTVREMDLHDLVLETDCPYLTPAPFRGQRNEPSYLRFVRDKVAELKGVDPAAVAAATTANASRIFKL